MQKILILGSSGQIGKYLTDYLKKYDFKIIEFDKEINEQFDIRLHNNQVLENSIKEADFIFFLAFDVGGSRYLHKYQNTYEYIENNISIMKNVFHYINLYNKKFIFASSQMSNMTFSNYGILKLIGESYTKSLNGLIVKFWNVYGYETNPDKYHAITDFILKAKNNGVIDMISNGKEERDLLYAEDCCDALKIIMDNYESFNSNSNLHVASFNSIKIIDVAKIIAKEFDAEVIPSVKKDTIQFNKKNKPDRFILNYWKPKTPIKLGIKNIIERIENEGY